MRSASTPPITKNENELIRYRIPIFLWSVVVSHDINPARGAGAAAWGRTWITATVVLRSRSCLSHDVHARHGRPVHVALEVVLPRWKGGDVVVVDRDARELAGLEELRLL